MKYQIFLFKIKKMKLRFHLILEREKQSLYAKVTIFSSFRGNSVNFAEGDL